MAETASGEPTPGYRGAVLHVGPYEVLITVVVLLLITVGPVAAGITLAWVRGKKRPPAP